MKRKAIILDRDGTLIVDKIYLNDPEQIEYLPGVFEALRLLRDDDFVFCIATNQSGVARGIVQIENLYEIHRRIRETFAHEGVDLLAFYYAPYMTDTNHPMRKPNAGMLLQAERELNLDLTKSWMIGDRLTDVEAGHRAGTKTALILGVEDPALSQYETPTVIGNSLLEIAKKIIADAS